MLFLSCVDTYAQIGQFLTGLARLPRLITLHDFEVSVLAPTNLVQANSPKLTFTLKIQAYQAIKSDSALETVNTTVTPSSTVTAENPEFNSVSTNSTNPDYQATVYHVAALLSPFRVPNFRPANFIDPSNQSPSVEDQFGDQSNWPNKKPDPLLSKFQYRGRIVAVDEVIYGLIQRPDGIITKVKVGQDVAQKSMRVIEITPTQINLVEQGVDSGAGVTAKRLALIAPVSP